jgi:hypothetical protein
MEEHIMTDNENNFPDIIIGGASNYTWDHLKCWVNSIKKSGFKGMIALVATNISKETIDKLVAEGVTLSLYGTQQQDGSFKAQSNGAPHVERFFYMWNFLEKLPTRGQFAYVIATDTRDVVFQLNPSEYLRINNSMGHEYIVSAEGLLYKDEPWNNRNLYEAFGPYFHNHLKDAMICNVGVLAGEYRYIKDLLLQIFQMSINRPIPVVDQAVFNFLINQQPYLSGVRRLSNVDAWAAQLGATLQAINAGKGDIGLLAQHKPSAVDEYLAAYKDIQPHFDEEGIVYNDHNEPFCIVHQYDRVPALKDKVEALYGSATI